MLNLLRKVIALNHTRIVAGLFFSVIVHGAALAQWQQTSGPNGGPGLTLALTSTQDIFSGVGNELFRSTDNGLSWSQVNDGFFSGPVNALTIDIFGTDAIFAGTVGGIFRSTDNGDTWSPANAGLTDTNIRSLSYVFDLFAGTPSGVFRSLDGGDNWTPINTGLTTTTVNVVFVSTSTGDVFAGTDGGGIFRSVDNGDTWAPANTGLTNLTVQAFTLNVNSDIIAATQGGLFRSLDGGVTWGEINTGLTTLSVRSLILDGSGEVFAGTFGNPGIFRSLDDGDTWGEVTTATGFIINEVNALLVNTDEDLFAATSGGIFAATAGGTDWVDANTGIALTDARALAINDNDEVFAGSRGGGIHFTADSGTSWSLLTNGVTSNDFRSFAINGDGNIFAGAFGTGLFRSVDNGAIWAQIGVGTGLIGTLITSVAIHPNGNVFAGIQSSGVFRSIDSGDNWTQVGAIAGLTSTGIMQIAINDADEIFVGTFDAGIFFSNDGGNSWSQRNNGLTNTDIRSFEFGLNDEVFAGSNSGGGVYRSTDSGQNWTPVNTGLGNTAVNALMVTPIGQLYAGTAGGVFRSQNNGDSWTEVSTGLVSTNVQALDFDSAGFLYAATNGSGVFSTANPAISPNQVVLQDSLALVDLFNSTDGPNWTNFTANWLSAQPPGTWAGVTVVNNRVVNLQLFSNGLNGSIPPSIGDLDGLTNLGLSGNQLSGPIPAEIGNLGGLTDLNLTANQLSGPIPVEIGNLTNLTFLGLGVNQFSGSVPAEIANLTNLTVLGLDDNELTGTILPNVSNLTELTVLDLSNNQFTGAIPPEIGNLTNLTNLLLSFNQFTGSIPAAIGNLTNLEVFGARTNQLSGPIPSEIGNLTSLTGLSLRFNQLSGSIPAQIANLTNLTDLFFGNNLLSGIVPPDFAGLTSLVNLDLSNNQLTDLPDLSVIPSLNVLEIQNNRFTFEDLEPNTNISGFVYSPQDSVGAEQDLAVAPGSTLNLSATVGGVNNQYQWFKNGAPLLNETNSTLIINPVAFADSGSYSAQITNTVATDLTLDRRPVSVSVQLSSLQEDSLALVDLFNSTNGANWTNNNGWLTNEPLSTWVGVLVEGDRVTAINLSGNNLSGTIPASIGNLTTLTTLALSQNQLTGSIPTSIGNLTNLTNLGLDRNQLAGTIPTELGNLTNLTILRIEGNQLTGSVPASFGNLTNLAELYFGANQLTGTIPVELWNLTNLVVLAMAENQFTGSLPAAIGNLTNLNLLSVFGNQFSGAIPPEVGNLTQLEHLDMGINQFSSVPTQIGNLVNLNFLGLSQNQITGSIPGTIVGLTNLTNLGLDRNNFTGSIPTQIGNLANLTTLRMEGNQLSGSIPASIGNLTNLTELYLGSNQLSGSIPAALGNLVNLQILDLALNQLSGAVPAGIANLVSLNTLLLFSNQLTDLPNIAQIDSLSDLQIQQNRFTFEDIEPNVGITGIVYSPQDSVGTRRGTSVQSGSVLDLQVTVGGANNLYAWFKDGGLLPNQTSSTLIIDPAELTDAGVYISQITNTVVPNLTLISRPITVSVVNSLAEQDSLALVDFFNSTGGPNWLDNTNWLSDQPVSTWAGIGVVNERVTDIFFNSNNNIAGPLPASIGNLTALKVLVALDNQISGALPVELGNLTELVTLDLRNNQLSGNIPDEIGNLTKLQTLILFSNELSGSIPATIGALDSLELFDLSLNQLTGAIPSEVGNLSKLVTFQVHSNQLAGEIPPELGNLTNLNNLSLSSNQLTGSAPAEIGNLANLRFLGMTDNQLSGALPPELGNLGNLETLDAGGNQFSGAIPTEIGNLTTLTNLGIAANQFTGTIPAEIGSLTNLTDLYLDTNQLTGAVPNELANLVNLKICFLYSNQLTDMPDLSLLDSLNTLEVYENQFTFEDIEPNIGIPNFVYSPQDSVGAAQDATILEGDSFTLAVTVGGSSNLYEWFKDGVSLTPEATSDSSFTIDAATIDDAGSYTCEIANSIATDLTLVSRPVQVTVQLQAPTIALETAVLDFGILTLGNNTERIASVQNTGSQDLTLSGLVVGPGASQFSLITAIPGTLQPLAAADITLRLSPTTSGIASAFLVLTSDAISSPDTIALVGLTVGADETEITLEGSVAASSIFSTDFDVDLSVDGELTTSWFSAGSIVDGDTSSYTWSNGRDDLITTVAVFSNARHPVFPLNFGFNSVTVLVRDAAENDLFRQTVTLAGTPDPDVVVHPNVVGRTVLLMFDGHESTDCGGFGELKIFADRQQVGGITVQPPVVTSAGNDAGITVVPPTNFVPTTQQLFFRRAGETAYQSSALAPAGNNFQGTIPASFITIRGVEYYISLSDGQTTITFPPTDAINNPSILPVQVAQFDFQSTLQPQVFKMISLPLSLANTAIDSVLLDDLGPYDVLPRQWRIFRFENDAYAEHENIAADFAPGNAFWLVTREGTLFDIENAQSVNTAQAATIVLQPGWNQIANPFAFAVDFASTTFTGNVQPPVFFDGADFQFNQTTLDPFEGYFINNLEAAPVTLTVNPEESQNTVQPAANKLVFDESDFVVQLSAIVPSTRLRDSQNFIGFRENATVDFDQFDRLDPPPIGEFVRLTIRDSDRPFAFNFKPMNDRGQEWEIEITSTVTNQKVTVSLTELGERPAGFERYVLDQDFRTVAPTAGDQFTVEVTQKFPKRNFTLLLGTKEFAEESSDGIALTPLEFALEQNYPNPFNPETTIRYHLDKPGDVRLEVFNLLGQKVRTLVAAFQSASEHQTIWNGRDDVGREVASGVYVYRLTAGESVATRKLLLIR